jgi:hypothetical protein
MVCCRKNVIPENLLLMVCCRKNVIPENLLLMVCYRKNVIPENLLLMVCYRKNVIPENLLLMVCYRGSQLISVIPANAGIHKFLKPPAFLSAIVLTTAECWGVFSPTTEPRMPARPKPLAKAGK